ncbi:hypothetical protein A2U01_0104428 [Trifolium medium]|uniref:Uncharacterized protein n=1 Tax=Trifolium medium TaxID=97028 RepID=A0A392V6W4_9FABA|nr:hypothetical protein [Trifolium medium]
MASPSKANAASGPKNTEGIQNNVAFETSEFDCYVVAGEDVQVEGSDLFDLFPVIC